MSKKTEQTATPWTPPAGPVTYIGPDIDGVTAHMTTYTGIVPEKLLEIARERCKAARQMLVPVDQIAKKMLAARTEGTAEHALYQKVKHFAEGE